MKLCSNLVLLVLRHQIVHVRLGLRELHLVHALAGVPMEEGLAPEHGWGDKIALFSNFFQTFLELFPKQIELFGRF